MIIEMRDISNSFSTTCTERCHFFSAGWAKYVPCWRKCAPAINLENIQGGVLPADSGESL